MTTTQYDKPAHRAATLFASIMWDEALAMAPTPGVALQSVLPSVFAMAVDYCMVQPEGMRHWWLTARAESGYTDAEDADLAGSARSFLKLFQGLMNEEAVPHA